MNDSLYRTAADHNSLMGLNLKNLIQSSNQLFATATPCPSLSGLQVPEKISRTNLYIKGLSEDFTDDRLWDLVPHKDHVKRHFAAHNDDEIE
ncbi:hypothetical protein Ciccas_003161 [Cichlidogyrus casuarinus]|uniref:Uncharacterized protein n=1 Tax=Cichlidogyrus casuarinus TaxID=1844966 RepID=A0ABD2QF62_9PLAT